MSNLREIYGIAKRKFQENKTNLGISLALAAASGPVLITAQTTLTFGLAKVLEHSTTPIPAIVVGLIALNTVSIAVEAKTLEKKRFSNNPPSSILNILVGDIAVRTPLIKDYPLLASIFVATVSHLYHLIPVGLMNPYLLYNFQALFMGDKGKLFLENFASISTALALWNIATNYLILNGKADPLVNTINKVGKKIKDKVVDTLRLYNEV